MSKETIIKQMQERINNCDAAAKDEAIKAISKTPEDEQGKALALRWLVKRDEMRMALEIVSSNL